MSESKDDTVGLHVNNLGKGIETKGLLLILV